MSERELRKISLFRASYRYGVIRKLISIYRWLHKLLNSLAEITSKNHNSNLVTHVRYACGTL